ncbi:hypothetical protein C8R46DRAFT_1048134 [Mycena filopes]|nr:hypothetical protein C8R46DRAFT_1048134 [Mycena filopes]
MNSTIDLKQEHTACYWVHSPYSFKLPYDYVVGVSGRKNKSKNSRQKTTHPARVERVNPAYSSTWIDDKVSTLWLDFRRDTGRKNKTKIMSVDACTQPESNGLTLLTHEMKVQLAGARRMLPGALFIAIYPTGKIKARNWQTEEKNDSRRESTCTQPESNGFNTACSMPISCLVIGSGCTPRATRVEVSASRKARWTLADRRKKRLARREYMHPARVERVTLLAQPEFMDHTLEAEARHVLLGAFPLILHPSVSTALSFTQTGAVTWP